MFKNTENLQAFVVNCAFIYSEKDWEEMRRKYRRKSIDATMS